MLTSRFKPTAALTLAVLPFALSQALAQTPEGGAATTLDAIMVTANKRVENVQEVPKQVMVVTPDTLSKSGVTTIAELGNAIPSIGGSVPSEQRASAPPLRGISSFSISIGVQTQTGIVIDDVPQASYSSLFKELTDIQSVEVLAGPQSTLSGRNASGGLINIVTREPSSEYFEAEASIEHTSDRQERFSAFLSGPLSDTLAFSVSAFSNEWDGWMRSRTEMAGNRPLSIGGWDTQGARGKLRWQPNDHLTATLTGYWMESTSLASEPTADGYFYFDPNARHRFDTAGRSPQQMYPGFEPKQYNRWLIAEQHSTFNTKDRGTSLKVDWEFPNGMGLTSISSYSKAGLPRHVNQFGIPTDNLVPSIPANPYRYADADYQTTSKIQELRLTSPVDQRVDYVVGVMYSDLDTWHPYQRLDLFPVDWIRTFDIESLALYGRGTLHVGERDALIAGIRYQRDDMGYSFDSRPMTNGIEPVYFSANRRKYDFFSGELSWRRELADNLNGYVTLSSAQSGEVYDLEDGAGANPANNGTGLQPLASQKVKNLEVGLKSQLWDRRLTFNVNAFLAKYDNFHVQFTDTPADPTQRPVILLLPIGKVETRGIELETRLRATENLNLSVNAAWVDAKIKEYPNAPCWSIRQTAEQGCVRQNEHLPESDPGRDRGSQGNIAGNSMPNAPKFKVSGALSYFVPLDNLPFDLELDTSWRWQSKTRFDYLGNPDLEQGSYGVLNLAATLLDRDNRYSISLFVNNVLDRNFYAHKGDNVDWRGGPALWGRFARDSFRYSGVRLKVNF